MSIFNIQQLIIEEIMAKHKKHPIINFDNAHHFAPLALHIIHDEVKEFGGYTKVGGFIAEKLVSLLPARFAILKDESKEIIDFIEEINDGGLSGVLQDKVIAEVDKCATATNISTDDAEASIKCFFSTLDSKQNKLVAFAECTKTDPANIIGELNKILPLIKCSLSDLKDQMNQAHAFVTKISKDEEGLQHFSALLNKLNKDQNFQQIAATNASSYITECASNSGTVADATESFNCLTNTLKIQSGIAQRTQYFLQCKNITNIDDASVELHNTISLAGCIYDNSRNLSCDAEHQN